MVKEKILKFSFVGIIVVLIGSVEDIQCCSGGGKSTVITTVNGTDCPTDGGNIGINILNIRLSNLFGNSEMLAPKC